MPQLLLLDNVKRDTARDGGRAKRVPEPMRCSARLVGGFLPITLRLISDMVNQLGSCKGLRRWASPAWGLLDSPGAAFADASFGSGGHLAELVAVLFVLVHLVVRDSLAGHAA